MKPDNADLKLFYEKHGRSVKIERRHTLRKFGLRSRSVLTAVAQNDSDYHEAIVRLTSP